MLRSKITARWLCITLASWLFSFAMYAQTPAPFEGVPRFLKFKGQVRDSSGQALNGQVRVSFAIYNEPTGGVPIWKEIQTVQFSSGYCSVLLGLASPGGIPADLFRSGQSRWLRVQPLVEGAQEQPRIFLTSVPYALKASDADTLGGLPSSAFVKNPTYDVQDSPYPDSSQSSETSVGSAELETTTHYSAANYATSHSASAQPVSSKIPTSSGVIVGPVTIKGSLTSSNSGPFAKTSMNQYLQSIVNNCSSKTEFQAIQGSSHSATDALTGCIAVPSSSSVFGGYAVAGYANTSSITTGITSGKFYARCLANGTQCNSVNGVAQDVRGLTAGVGLWSEFDTQPQNAPTVYKSLAGVLSNLYAPISGTFGNSFVASKGPIAAGYNGQWGSGFLCIEGAVANGCFTSGAQGTATSSSGNYPANSLTMMSDYWTGSAAAYDFYKFTTSIGSGSPPRSSSLNITHVPGISSDYGLNVEMPIAAGGQLTFSAGLGSISQIEGPSDEPLQIGSQNDQNINLAPNGTGAIIIGSSLEGTTSTATQIGSQNNQNIRLSPNGTGQTIITSLAGRGSGLVGVSNTGQLSNAGISISTGTASGCITGSASYARCSSVVNISPAQPNVNFIPSCNGSGPSGVPAILSVTPASTSSIMVTITNGTNNGAEPSTYGTLYCIAIQPSSF